MHTFLKKIFLAFIITFSSFPCFCQREGDISLGLSLDYGFGAEFNNRASTLRFNYNILEKLRVVPSFSYFLNKENIKMRAFSLNFHYLFPELVSKYIPVAKRNGILLYSIAGFFISGLSGSKDGCSTCASEGFSSASSYFYNFGFDFGIGVEYKLPILLPLLRDMSVNFETQYMIVDKYSRPVVSFGLLYGF